MSGSAGVSTLRSASAAGHAGSAAASAIEDPGLRRIMAVRKYSGRIERTLHSAILVAETFPDLLVAEIGDRHPARVRFRRIQELLSDPEKTLKEIAELAGMNHVTHLHEFIRKRCGLTPAQLRSHLRN